MSILHVILVVLEQPLKNNKVLSHVTGGNDDNNYEKIIMIRDISTLFISSPIVMNSFKKKKVIIDR